MMMMMMMINIR